MSSITIASVRCSLLSATKLQIEIPSGWSGVQLAAWQAAHRDEAIAVLTTSEESEESDEPG